MPMHKHDNIPNLLCTNYLFNHQCSIDDGRSLHHLSKSLVTLVVSNTFLKPRLAGYGNRYGGKIISFG